MNTTIQELDPQQLAASFVPVCVHDAADCNQVNAATEQYRRMLLCTLLTILQRYERSGRYFIDTKLDIISGRDFPLDDPIRGPNTIYTWIQGRGLEALAGHAGWVANDSLLPSKSKQAIAAGIRSMVLEVSDQMEHLRALNHGRLSFMMSSRGDTLCIDDQGRVCHAGQLQSDSPANFSDLFYAKGLAAAACLLDDAPRLEAARLLLRKAFADLAAGRFASDQQPMDPMNPVRRVPDRFPQGPWMIAVGAASLLLRLTGQAEYVEMGRIALSHLFQYHVCRPGIPRDGCCDYDTWEYVDAAGNPATEPPGILRCDPGHATELAGLGLGFLRRCRELDLAVVEDAEFSRILQGVLLRNFGNGFTREIGICKAFDLVQRRPINTDMPWWSLPETIRAAMEAQAVATHETQPVFRDMARRCSNAFMKHYLRPDRHLMANQTINETGAPVSVIPATPDADPGYHTGLSIIDSLEILA